MTNTIALTDEICKIADLLNYIFCLSKRPQRGHTTKRWVSPIADGPHKNSTLKGCDKKRRIWTRWPRNNLPHQIKDNPFKLFATWLFYHAYTQRPQRGHTTKRLAWPQSFGVHRPSRMDHTRTAPWRGATKNAEHEPDGQGTTSRTRHKAKLIYYCTFAKGPNGLIQTSWRGTTKASPLNIKPIPCTKKPPEKSPPSPYDL